MPIGFFEVQERKSDKEKKREKKNTSKKRNQEKSSYITQTKALVHQRWLEGPMDRKKTPKKRERPNVG